MTDEKDESQIKRNKRFTLYFRLTCILWLLILSTVMCTPIGYITLSIPFIFLLIGVLIGFFGKRLLLNYPWLLLLLPILYMLFSMVY